MEIKLTNVTYEKFHKLNLFIPADEITGITGSGKSDILKILTGKLKNTGDIFYNDEKLSNKNKLNITKSISYIEQTFINKYAKSTIEEYMLYIIQYYKLNLKDPQKKIIDSLKIVDLKEEYLTRNINNLSTSEKKQFQIAISLIINPKLILLDEPFVGLDVKNIKKLNRLLTQLNDKYKIAIVIASNNCEILYKYTKHIIILKDYKVLQEGNTKEVYEAVDFLLKEQIEIPEITLFTYKAKIDKNSKIDYHRDIRDLIKDIYKHI